MVTDENTELRGIHGHDLAVDQAQIAGTTAIAGRESGQGYGQHGGQYGCSI